MHFSPVISINFSELIKTFTFYVFHFKNGETNLALATQDVLVLFLHRHDKTRQDTPTDITQHLFH